MAIALEMRFRKLNDKELECNYWNIETKKYAGWVVFRRANRELWVVTETSASMSKKKHVPINNRMFNLLEHKYETFLVEEELLSDD